MLLITFNMQLLAWAEYKHPTKACALHASPPTPTPTSPCLATSSKCFLKRQGWAIHTGLG